MIVVKENSELHEAKHISNGLINIFTSFSFFIPY
jgi:hypothetical protein